MVDEIEVVEEKTIDIELDNDILVLGDMKKEVYDTNNNGIVDNAEKVNNHTVESDVPSNAVFTDTIYDDTQVKRDIQTNTTDISNIKQEQTMQNTNIQTNASNISNLQTNKADKSEIPDVSNFITNSVDNLLNYTLKTNTGSLIDLEVNSSTYVVTLYLKDIDGNIISTDTIDLPLESVVVSGSFDNINKKIILTLQNGNTVDIPVGDLVAGLQTELSSTNKLNADYIDDTNSGKKLVTTSEKNTWNAKVDESNLTDYVKNTDYASDSKGGVIKTGVFGTFIGYNNALGVQALTYQLYQTQGNNYAISKGTLENVLNARIGDINTVLDSINGEEV